MASPVLVAYRRHGRSRPESGLPELPTEILEGARVAGIRMGAARLTQIGVTSALRGEGRSTMAMAMAAVQSVDLGRRVLLLDLDLRGPGTGPRGEGDGRPGLVESLMDHAPLGEVIKPGEGGIDVITSGRQVESPLRVLREMARLEVLDQLASIYDIVIADLPPLLSCSHGREAAGAFSDLLLVIRAGVTPAALLREAVTDLPTPPVAVLNRWLDGGRRRRRWLQLPALPARRRR